MSFFTKKELDELKRCLKYMMKGGVTPYSNLTIELNKKIQHMINNHCEHSYELVGCGIDCYAQCTKCGHKRELK